MQNQTKADKERWREILCGPSMKGIRFIHENNAQLFYKRVALAFDFMQQNYGDTFLSITEKAGRVC